jgi:hypothetical protein
MDWFSFGPLAWTRDFLNTHPRAEGFLQTIGLPAEAILKKTIFGCQSCGQCLLHENGYTCPMRCPKTSRNGPCGGVRANGHCEVYPERWCVWYRAYYRSKNQSLPMPQSWRDDMYHVHPPVNWELINTSSVINEITGRAHGIPPTAPAKKPAAKVAPKAG